MRGRGGSAASRVAVVPGGFSSFGVVPVRRLVRPMPRLCRLRAGPACRVIERVVVGVSARGGGRSRGLLGCDDGVLTHTIDHAPPLDSSAASDGAAAPARGSSSSAGEQTRVSRRPETFCRVPCSSGVACWMSVGEHSSTVGCTGVVSGTWSGADAGRRGDVQAACESGAGVL